MTGTNRGLVLRAQSRSFTVLLEAREERVIVPNSLRRRHPDAVDPLAVGDEVVVERTGAEWVVQDVLPRRNALMRRAVGQSKRQVVAANLDLAVVILSAREPSWKPSTLDRYLVMASSGGVLPLVVLNKIDLDPSLAGDPELAMYPSFGVPVLFVSAQDGTGLPALRERLAGRTSAMLGPSGAGKSSLLNRLVPEALVRVQDVSASTGRGKHTTTWVEMLALPGGGWLVDSPGLRALDLSLVTPEDLAQHFPEIAGLDTACRFPDCRHLEEPSCAVKEAVAKGTMAPHRYASFRRILESLGRGDG